MRYLLDTCVISEFNKKVPSPSLIAWLSQVDEGDLFLSSITIGEIRKGIEILNPGDSRHFRLQTWYDSIIEGFSSRIISFDKTIAAEWGRMVGLSIREGRTKPAIDIQIAATAFTYGLTLVTRNVKDMANVGVKIFNPFEFRPD